MAITRTSWVRFLFEDSDGELWDVSLAHDGTGVARQVSSVGSTPRHDATEIALQVDVASVAAWRAYHVSRKMTAAVYNTAKTLDAVLTA